MKVTMDPQQLVEMGVSEQVVIDLPEGFERFGREQRRAWARGEVLATLAAMGRDLGLPAPDPDDPELERLLRQVGLEGGDHE